MSTIDTTEIRTWLSGLKDFTRKSWRAASFCRARKEDGTWHETSKISVQRGVYGSMSPADAELAAAAPRLHATAFKLVDEVERLQAENLRLKEQSKARPAPGEGEQDLSARLQANGMFTIEQMLQPLSRFQIHASMKDLDAFDGWLEAKCREYTSMQARYDLGDRDKEDDLYEWIVAHCGAYHDALVNFRAARKDQAACEEDDRAPASAHSQEA